MADFTRLNFPLDAVNDIISSMAAEDHVLGHGEILTVLGQVFLETLIGWLVAFCAQQFSV